MTDALAQKISLDMIVAEIESANYARALRFEPSVYGRMREPVFSPVVARIIHVHSCSHETAYMIGATSWGLFQLMGFNIYSDELSFGGPIFDWVTSTSIQTNDFFAFVSKRKIDLSPDELCFKSAREKFAEVYNGPGNVTAYAEKISAVLSKYGYEVRS